MALPSLLLEGGALRSPLIATRRSATHQRLCADVVADSPAAAVRITVRFSCERSWYLTAAREIRPVVRPVRPPFPVGRFLVVDQGGALSRWDLPWAGSFDIRPGSTFVDVMAMIRDPLGCGLSLNGVDRLIPENPPSYRISLIGNRLASAEECPWIEPYPGGARAAVCLTDHADFDSTPKMAQLADLFGRTAFRITKSVFPASDPMGEKREPGVDDLDFARECLTLRDQGSEIAFHGIGPRVQSPTITEWRRRAELMAPFSPRTWIDHGKGPYLFSRTARLPDGTPLCEFLAPLGVVNYWSYADTWDNPFVDLGSWRSRAWRESLRDVLVGWHSLAGTRRAVDLAYLVSHSVKNLVGADHFVRVRSHPMSLRAWAASLATRRNLARRQAGPLIYALDGSTTFASAESSLRVFDTLALNHLAHQLSPGRMEKLASDSELLLGHCYIGAQHPYMTGNVFIGEGDRLRISPGFAYALESIDGLQRGRELISLPFSLLRSHLDTLAAAVLARNAAGWEIESPDGPSLTIAGPAKLFPAPSPPELGRFAAGRILLISHPAGRSFQPTRA